MKENVNVSAWKQVFSKVSVYKTLSAGLSRKHTQDKAASSNAHTKTHNVSLGYHRDGALWTY